MDKDIARADASIRGTTGARLSPTATGSDLSHRLGIRGPRLAHVACGWEQPGSTSVASKGEIATRKPQKPALDSPAAFWKTPPVKQSIVTLDMEGVLTPEIWIAVAEKTGIKELRRTTRDEPDYDKLMRGRLEILDQHGLKLSDIQQVIGTLRPLAGAKEFLDELRSLVQVIILSDTFEQFATPLLRQLGWPTLLCHRLVVENDRIVDYQLRVPEQKQQAVAAFKLLNYYVICRRGFLQRHRHADRSQRRLPVPRARQREAAVPPVPGGGGLCRLDEADQGGDGVRAPQRGAPERAGLSARSALRYSGFNPAT